MLRRRQTAPGTYVSFAIKVTKVAFGAHRDGVGSSLRYGANLVMHTRYKTFDHSRCVGVNGLLILVT